MRCFLALLTAITLALGAVSAASAAHRSHPPAKPAKPTAPAAPAAPASGSADTADDAPATPAFGGLASITEADARARLGPPDIARTDGAGAMWTYRLPDCALFIFFRSTAGQPLRVSGASAGPRRRGQPPAPIETCVAEASQPRAQDRP
jgi:hypothetical protein